MMPADIGAADRRARGPWHHGELAIAHATSPSPHGDTTGGALRPLGRLVPSGHLFSADGPLRRPQRGLNEGRKHHRCPRSTASSLGPIVGAFQGNAALREQFREPLQRLGIAAFNQRHVTGIGSSVAAKGEPHGHGGDIEDVGMELGVEIAQQPLRGGRRVIGEEAGKVLGVTLVEVAQRLDQRWLLRTKMQFSCKATSSSGFQGIILSDLEYGVRSYHEHLRRLTPIQSSQEEPERDNLARRDRKLAAS